MNKGMSGFLSEGAIREHEEYVRRLRHKASIYKKSGFDVLNLNEREIYMLKIPLGERSQLSRLALEIKLHDIYFDSFGDTYVPCQKIKESFGSENSFAYELLRFASGLPSGFVTIYKDRAGRIGFSEASDTPRGADMLLAIDVFEHAYFRDYGFAKDKYLRACAAHLNFGKINCSFLPVCEENN